MLQYVNEFTCTLDEAGKTMIINFRQNEPKIEIDENGNENWHTVKNEISSVIMEAEGARMLASLINQVFENSESKAHHEQEK